jgi:hypothetical protein
MITDLFKFQWKVDQDGYEVTADEVGREVLRPRGPRWRYYRPLEDDGLWLRFAETCRNRDGVLQFVGEYGLLRDAQDWVEYDRGVAGKLWVIASHLDAGDRRSAKELFNDESRDSFAHPRMTEHILWSPDKPEVFEPAIVPEGLEDALRHQALEAITGNRQFRRCRNEGCANWFRLGPRSARDGGHTYTVRREFCSDRCRVAYARRQRREGSAHA